MSYLNKQNYLIKNQRQPLSEDQVENNAGGYVYEITKWQRLDRFLILGSEQGTYYSKESDLTLSNVDNLESCIKEDGIKVINTILALDRENRAPKLDPLIYALAVSFTIGNQETKNKVKEVFTDLIRTGTHLFTFVDFINQMRGWGRSLRDLVASWYRYHHLNNTLDYQLLKYQNRKGWSHADVLKKCHLGYKATPNNIASIRWALRTSLTERQIKKSNTDKIFTYQAVGDLPNLLKGYETIKESKKLSEVVSLIKEHNFTHEMVPNEWKKSTQVWDALLPQMPLIATIRNLSRMTAINYLQPFSESTKLILRKLDKENILKSRIHPIQILMAQLTYKAGKGVRGSLNWKPVSVITDALEDAFYTSFQNVEPTNKNTLVAIDISASMNYGVIAGCIGLTPAIAAAALALVIARTEPNYQIFAFDTIFYDLEITKKDSLSSVLRKTSDWGGGATDCSVPFTYASKSKLGVDTFITITDNETWYGSVHPKTAFKRFKEKMNKPRARTAVLGLTSTSFSIADPKDPDMIDFVGFDAAMPKLLSMYSNIEF